MPQVQGADGRPRENRAAMALLALLLQAAAAGACLNCTATAVGVVIGSGSLRKAPAHSAELCCELCVAEPACAAYTFEKKDAGSMCFLKDNVAQCGAKAQATSGMLPDRTPKAGGACGANPKADGGGYLWPPPSDRGSLWVVLALLFLVTVGGPAYLIISEKRLRKRGVTTHALRRRSRFPGRPFSREIACVSRSPQLSTSRRRTRGTAPYPAGSTRTSPRLCCWSTGS